MESIPESGLGTQSSISQESQETSASDSEVEIEKYQLRPSDENSSINKFIIDESKGKTIRIGKSRENNDFVINHETVGETHAVLKKVSNAWLIYRKSNIKKSKSSYFVKVNEKKLKKPRFLEIGDEIGLGKKGSKTEVKLTFEKYDGQWARINLKECQRQLCYAIYGRDHLCYQCAHKERETFRKLVFERFLKVGHFALIPKTKNGSRHPIRLDNDFQTQTFGGHRVSFEYDQNTSVSVTFIRGRKGYYLTNDSFKLHPRCLTVNRESSELFMLLKEGDQIEVGLEDSKENYEYHAENGAVDDLSNESAVNEAATHFYRHYLCPLVKEGRTLPFRGKTFVVEVDNVDKVLDLGEPRRETRVKFSRTQPDQWFVNSLHSEDDTSYCYLNGIEPRQAQRLFDGDIVRFGDFSQGRMHQFRFTAIPDDWSVALDSGGDDRTNLRNCLDERIFVNNCQQKGEIALTYKDSREFVRSLVIDNHQQDSSDDKLILKLNNFGNHYYLQKTRIRNIQCSNFNQELLIGQTGCQNNITDTRILNSDCGDYKQSLSLEVTNQSVRSNVMFGLFNIRNVDKFDQDIKISCSSNNAYARVLMENIQCKSFLQNIEIKDIEIQKCSREIFLINDHCVGYKQNISIENRDVKNGFQRVWLVNRGSEDCDQTITVKNMKCQDIHVEIMLNNFESRKCRVQIEVENESIENCTYTVHYLYAKEDSVKFERNEREQTEKYSLILKDFETCQKGGFKVVPPINGPFTKEEPCQMSMNTLNLLNCRTRFGKDFDQESNFQIEIARQATPNGISLNILSILRELNGDTVYPSEYLSHLPTVAGQTPVFDGSWLRNPDSARTANSNNFVVVTPRVQTILELKGPTESSDSIEGHSASANVRDARTSINNEGDMGVGYNQKGNINLYKECNVYHSHESSNDTTRKRPQSTEDQKTIKRGKK